MVWCYQVDPEHITLTREFTFLYSVYFAEILHSDVYSVMVVYVNLQIDFPPQNHFPLTFLCSFVKLCGLK